MKETESSVILLDMAMISLISTSTNEILEAMANSSKPKPSTSTDSKNKNLFFSFAQERISEKLVSVNNRCNYIKKVISRKG